MARLPALCSAVLLLAAIQNAQAQYGELTATLTGRRSSSLSDTITLDIAVEFTPGWRIGAAKPGKIGLPTELNWQLPLGWRILSSRWPSPTSSIVGRDTVYEYREAFVIGTTVLVGGRERSGPIQVTLSYAICKDVCIPGRRTLRYEVR